MLFHQACEIVKAEPQKDSLRVIIRASTDTKDRQDEVVLKSAFSQPEMIRQFGREGYYDYNHLTDLYDQHMRKAGPAEWAEIQLQKTKAIIGYPDQSQPIEVRSDGVYSVGYLIPGNEFVKEIRKGLESGWGGWGASISGTAHSSNVENGKIKAITLRKIAICPLQEAINPDTSVSLAKSFALTDVLQGRVEKSSLVEDVIPQTLADVDSRRLRILWDAYMNSDRFIDLVASELVAAINAGLLRIEFDEIANFLGQRFAIDPADARDVSNKILRNINL